MIEVYIGKTDGRYNRWKVIGHAGYAELGKDIVCAAVSALTCTLEEALIQLTDARVTEYRYASQEEPKMLLLNPSAQTDLLLGMFRAGIEGIEAEYPDYVKLHLET